VTGDPSGGPPGPPGGTDPDPGPSGTLRQLGPGAVVVALCLGLVVGWSVRRVAAYADTTAPLVSWSQAGVLFLAAAILGVLTWHTRRALDGRHPRPESHRLVNRLVLARASAIAGAFVGGGYLGYAVSWLGVGAELADERAVRSLLAGLGGLLVLMMSLLLERACRVPGADDQS
jgi:hypothetical protein